MHELTADGRRLALAALVQSLGIGLFTASSIAWFTRHVGLTANQVATGLAVAGAAALAASLLAGVLADRHGARRILAVVYAGRGLCFLAFAFVTNLWEYLVVTLLSVAFDRAGPPVLQALVAAALPEQRDRGRLLAVVNVVRNIGLGLGAMAGGVTLTLDTTRAYRITMLLITAAFLGGALLVRRLPATPRPTAAPAGEGGRARALPGRHYLTLTGLNFLLSFFDVLLLVAMPVWVLQHTSAPRATVSVLYALNTVLVVVAQLPVSRLADGLRRSSRMLLWGGAALAASSLCFAAAGAAHGRSAVLLLVAAILALSLGEVVTTSATWNLSIALAPAEARGRYLSIFGLGLATERVFGPVVVTGLLLGSGAVGWAGAAVVFALTGAVAERVALAGGAQIPALVGEGTP
ncbi:MFS transporter [Kitasatospora sp. NBC_01250]|uniref:MFS transporter n=1 Tax=Kitasatospora sp. NBC_01250 TaxID=2903571 RepID=UPI002E332B9D|nr:MFS transporter [Kitasatospora sp. NBC_01250]